MPFALPHIIHIQICSMTKIEKVIMKVLLNLRKNRTHMCSTLLLTVGIKHILFTQKVLMISTNLMIWLVLTLACAGRCCQRHMVNAKMKHWNSSFSLYVFDSSIFFGQALLLPTFECLTDGFSPYIKFVYLYMQRKINLLHHIWNSFFFKKKKCLWLWNSVWMRNSVVVQFWCLQTFYDGFDFNCSKKCHVFVVIHKVHDSI